MAHSAGVVLLQKRKIMNEENKIHNINKLYVFRKKLRNQATPAEAKLWTYLKNAQLSGRKFRRQHSVGNYILDFYCPSERLAVELDGEVHNTPEAYKYDRARDLFLSGHDIKTLRFENKLVFQEIDAVLAMIESHFTG